MKNLSNSERQKKIDALKAQRAQREAEKIKKEEMTDDKSKQNDEVKQILEKMKQ